jgi:hypothetical protein
LLYNILFVNTFVSFQYVNSFIYQALGPLMHIISASINYLLVLKLLNFSCLNIYVFFIRREQLLLNLRMLSNYYLIWNYLYFIASVYLDCSLWKDLVFLSNLIILMIELIAIMFWVSHFIIGAGQILESKYIVWVWKIFSH